MANQVLEIELFTAQPSAIIQADQFETGRVDVVRLTSHGQAFSLTKRQAKLVATDREGITYEVPIQADPAHEGAYTLTYPDKFFNNAGLFIQARVLIMEAGQLLYTRMVTIFVRVAAPGSYSLPAASEDTLGGVKIGEGLSIDETGKLSVLDDIEVIDPSQATLSDGEQTITIKADVVKAKDYKPGMENVWVSGTLQEIRTALANGGTATTDSLTAQAQEVVFSSNEFKNTMVNLGVISGSTPVGVYLSRKNKANAAVNITQIVRETALYVVRSNYTVAQFPTLTAFDVSNASNTGVLFVGLSAVTALNTLLVPTKVTALPTVLSEALRNKLYLLPDGSAYILNYAGNGFTRIDQPTANLKKMYANSIDFGSYDYSGNPNLLPNLTANDFRFTNTAVTGYTKTDSGTYIKVTKASGAASVGLITGSVTRLKSNTTYMLSVKAKALATIAAGGLTFTLRWKDSANVTRTADAFEGQTIPTTEKVFIKTFTTGEVADGTAPSLQLYFNGDLVGDAEVDLYYSIKLEKGATATPYQPNLIDTPYYLSKLPLGENLADKTVTFPIKSSEYKLYDRDLSEKWAKGTYTLRIKGTKPATQSFNLFLDSAGTVSGGAMKPVEGLVDVWEQVITISQETLDRGIDKRLQIYQSPSSSVGACQIDWLKIEKGSTATPNIDKFNYIGESTKDSSNPLDYTWRSIPASTESTTASTVG